ncbi:hypothetical protein [Staphylothermus hellenicus]|uniref:hypothetical protein n=1 Tax=Staphylothermus hellenicus TaxID=84599 RepID=UPI0011E504BE|nr:hypothetical protein [Staphylothermus hellenicus]
MLKVFSLRLKQHSTAGIILKLEYWLRAKSHAIDIDQGGVINEDDFAPYINNYLIYGGIATLLALSYIGVSTCLRRLLRRKRAKKMAYEREKAKIISMIDEAIGRRKKRG